MIAPADVVDALHAVGHRRRFARREVLFHEGDPADSFHLVLKGRVAVRVATSLGTSVTLDVVNVGEIIGELAVLAPGPRSASVAALEPVETLSVAAGSLAELRAAAPHVLDHLVTVLVERNRQLAARLAEATSISAEVRVLRRLLEVARMYEQAPDEAVVVPLTQDDLAGLAATTRETVNRVLRREEDAGSLALQRGRISVLDVLALHRRAGA